MDLKPFYALDPIIHDIPDLLYADSQYLDRLFAFLDSSIQPPFSISVNGNWGSGKTSLMKGMQNKFEEKGYPTLWFNPWEYERADDIVFCFLVELSRFATSKKLKGGATELGVFGLSLLTSGLDLTARLLTNNKLSFKEVNAIQKEVREAIEGRYSKENPVEIIKKDFSKLTRKIAEKHEDHPLVVFLDDLDRCLPDNSLDLLEALKNLFVVPEASVIFISGIDTGVAKQFIIQRYEGLDANFAHNYFKKIFNFTINTPVLTRESFEVLLRTRLEELLPAGNPMWTGSDEEKAALPAYLSGLLVESGVKSIRQAYNILHNWIFALSMNPALMLKHKQYLVLFTIKECWPDFFETCCKLANKKPEERFNALVSSPELATMPIFAAMLIKELQKLDYDMQNKVLLEI